jgi:hypothetical protein
MSRRRAVPAIAAGAAVFVLLNAGLGLWAEQLPRIRDPYYGDKFVKLKAKADRPDRGPLVIVYGSSRTGFAFNGTLVERTIRDAGGRAAAFNYGIPAMGPIGQLLYFRRTLADGVRPDFVLVEVLPSMFAKSADGPREQHWMTGDRLLRRELDTVERYGYSSPDVRGRWWESSLVPVYGLRFQLLGRVIQSWIPWQFRQDWSRGTDESGWCTPYKDVITANERAFATAKARDEYSAVLQTWQLDDTLASTLDELLGECRNAGIPAKLLLMPESGEFQAMAPADVQKRIDEFLRGRGVPVIDARDWLDAGDFTDGHHQLRRGAEKFSKRLALEVILPWVSGR